MIEVLRKTLYASVGLAHMTREKIEDLGRKLAEEAHLSEIDGKKFVDELQKKAGDARDASGKFIEETIQKTLEKLEIPTRKDIDALKKRIEALESARKDL